MRRAAAGMLALGLTFDEVLSSPYVRAKQTADIVCKVFRIKHGVHMFNPLAPGTIPANLVSELNHSYGKRESLLLVGHEPDLSELVSFLTTGSSSGLSVTLKKGALCKLTVDSLQPERCAALEWLLTAGQLARVQARAGH